MALPVQHVPQYTLKLPSSGEEILFRPFLVREEKILLMAVDDSDEVQIRALRQVLENCLLPDKRGKKVDVSSLPMFDLDYIWLKLRSKSVEENVTLPFECRAKLPEGAPKKVRDGEEIDYCGEVVNVPINLDKIEVLKNPENQAKIELFDGIGIKLKYPTFEIVQKLAKLKEISSIDETFEVIMECIEMIYEDNGEKVYEKEYIEKDELLNFLENLSQAQFAKIMKFFETLPILRHEVHFKCPRCKHAADIVLEGTKSFLSLDSAMKASQT